MVFSTQFYFYLSFIYFLIFLLSTYYDMCLFVCFYVNDSKGIVVSIRQRNHIKFMFIIFYQI